MRTLSWKIVGNVWIVAAALYMGTNASAQTPWKQEPTSFRGVILGELLDRQMPVCAPAKAAVNAYGNALPQAKVEEKKPCYKHDTRYIGTPLQDISVPLYLDVDNLPNIRIGPEGSVIVLNGRVQSLGMSFPSTGFAFMRQLLTEKFGLPHQRREIETTFTFGNSQYSEELVWQGKKVQIVLNENVVPLAGLGTSTLTVRLVAWLNRRGAQWQHQVDSVKDNL